jgi:hypothetical protein
VLDSGQWKDASVSAYASQMVLNETHRAVDVPRSAWLTQTIDRIGGASDVASSVVAVAVVECTDAMQVHVPPPDRPVPASLVWRSCRGLAGAGHGGMLRIYHGIMSAFHLRAPASVDAQDETVWCKECKVVGLKFSCPGGHGSDMFTSKIPDGVGLVWRCVFSEVSDLWRRDGRPVMLPHHRACVLRGLDMLFATGPDSFDVARLDRLGRGPGMIPAVDVRVARSLLAPSGPGPRVVFLVTTPRFVRLTSAPSP